MAVSIVTYTGDGSTTQYVITFEYISRDDVVVTIDGVAATFSFVNDTTVEFSSAPAVDATIVIKRGTPSAPLVDFTDGSTLFEADLDLAHQQSRYLAEEARDIAEDAKSTVDANITNIDKVADISTDVTTVAGQISPTNNISTLGGIASDITTAAGISTAINNVSSISSAVSTVSSDSADVQNLASISADLQTLADLEDGTTATNALSDLAVISSQISTVAADQTDIGIVSSNIAAVNTVATNIDHVIDVANDLNEAVSEIETVANDLNEATSEIEIVSNNIASVQTVGTNISSVSSVANISSDVSSVASISADITTVANTDLTAVINNASNIATVGNNIASVNTVSSDISSVTNVSNNINSVNTFSNQYTISATEPSSANEGLLWFDTSTDTMKVYNGSSFQNAGSSVNGTSSRGTFTATSGQTVFTTTGYDSGFIDIFMNGVKLVVGTDVTATNGTTFTLTTGAAAGDIVEYIAYGTFELTSVYTQAQSDARYLQLTGGTLTGDLIVGGNLTISGTTTTVNSTTLDVADLNITVANGAADAAAANGAGLTVDGAGATFNYAATGDKWTMNKPLEISGSITADNITYDIVSTAVTVEKNTRNACDVSSAAFTMTLPTAPSTGDFVEIRQIAGDFSVNNLTVAGNGNNINGDTSLIVDVAYAQLALIYNGTEWRVS